MKVYISGKFLAQHTTGVQRYSYEVINGIDHILENNSAKDVTFTILVPKKAPLNKIPQLKNIQIKRVGMLKGQLWEQFELPFYSKDGLLFCPSNTAPIFNLIKKSKVVVTVHDLSYLYFPSAYNLKFRLLYKALMPFVLKRADHIITVSESEKSEIEKRYSFVKSKIIAIQNGGAPSDSQISENIHKKNNKKKILYLGSLSLRKNFEGFIKAAQIIQKKENVEFLVVGSKRDIFSKSAIKPQKSLLEGFRFLGQIEEWPTIKQIYSEAFCLVFPSFYEASPLPPIEAMSCGCPVIGSKIPSIEERCRDGVIFCDPQKPQDIAEKVITLIRNPGLVEKIRSKGYEVAKRYSWKKCSEQTLKEILKFAS